MARTRLIVVGPTPPPAHGVSVMTVHLLDALRRQGRLAAHLDTRDPRPVHTIGMLDLHNVRLALEHALRFIGLLVRHRGAAVCVPISQGRWGFVRDAVFLLAARLARRDRYVHLHGGMLQDFYRDADPLLRALVRLSLGGARQAWVLTERLRDNFDGLIERDRVRVLENAVDDFPVPDDTAATRNGDGTPDDRLRLLFVSNIVPDKGAPDVVEAVAQLGDDARRVELVLVGQVDDANIATFSEPRRRAEAAGARIEVAGQLGGDELHEQFRRADVFVFPSRYSEGQPLVLLEALAAGLPIVATDGGGVPDTVGDDALLVPRHDPPAFADALRTLLGDPALRERMSRSARRRYEERYTIDAYGERLAALLDS